MKFPPEEETPKRDCRWKHYQWPVRPADEDAAEDIENHDTNSPALKPREPGPPQRLDNTPTKAHQSVGRPSRALGSRTGGTGVDRVLRRRDDPAARAAGERTREVSERTRAREKQPLPTRDLLARDICRRSHDGRGWRNGGGGNHCRSG